MAEKGTALVVGSTGITGGNLATHLAANGWKVFGLARNPKAASGVDPVAADLLDPVTLKDTLAPLNITDVFYTTWLRQPTEAENIRVNGAMMENLFSALADHRIRHAALTTGTKHYLGPFESYGRSASETPFREDNPRLPARTSTTPRKTFSTPPPPARASPGASIARTPSSATPLATL